MYAPLIRQKSHLKNLYFRFGLILLINLIAYGFGCFITGNGMESRWYTGLEKAAWTSGIFTIGLGWLVSLMCFSIFLFFAWDHLPYRKLLTGIFILHWVLNFAMDPVFFNLHWVLSNVILMLGLEILLIATLLICLKGLKAKSIILAPYLFWIGYLISQNLFIYLNN